MAALPLYFSLFFEQLPHAEKNSQGFFRLQNVHFPWAVGIRLCARFRVSTLLNPVNRRWFMQKRFRPL
jgi:hypothetical protein